ncbi:MAG: PTS sugar transporter subunit IIA [Planctomycetota bacterium]|jgi:mannitol/fructose-specific phosphotransferase system IIA component (Ntr-type)
MSFLRALKQNLIKASLDTHEDPELLEDPERSIRYKRELKESVLSEIVDLFESAGTISNRSKLLTDLVNREKKASTALGRGVAVPHVRTKQARSFTAAVLRSPEGIWFDSMDEEPVFLFFAMVAPPYEDQAYLKAFRQISKAIEEYPEMTEKIMREEDVEGIRRTLQFYLR